jgi:hypothetical protein
MAYSHFDKYDQLDWAERDLERKQRRAGLEVADGSSAIAFDDDDEMFSSRWGEHSARQMSLKRMPLEKHTAAVSIDVVRLDETNIKECAANY